MCLVAGLVALLCAASIAFVDGTPTQIMRPPSSLQRSNVHRHAAQRRRHSDTSLARRPTSSESGWVSIAYFGNWDVYGRNFMPNQVPADQLTHLLYSFANIDSNGTIVLSDIYADTQKLYPGDVSTELGNNVYGGFKQLYLLKQQNPHLKTALSIGGWTYQTSFENITDSGYRTNFVDSAVRMVADFGLDQIDVDYEYPTIQTISAFSDLLTALRKGLDDLAAELNTTPFLLSIAMPAGPKNYMVYQPELSNIAQHVDFFNLMSYDYCGPWQNITCDVANVNGGLQFNTKQAVTWYLQNGVRPKQLAMGNPLYGYAYSGTLGHYQTSTGFPPGDFGANGTYDYSHLPLGTNPQIFEDLVNITSWSYDSSSETFASYDTPKIARKKAEWLMQQDLAGAMYWEISGDKTSTEDSLVYQYVSAFQEDDAGLDCTPNHLSYPTSQFDNIKNGMGTAPSSPATPPNPTTTTTTTTTTTAQPAPTPTSPGSSGGAAKTTPPTTAEFIPCDPSQSACQGLAIWQQNQAYSTGDQVQCNNNRYKANWYVDAEWWQDDTNQPWPLITNGAWTLVSQC